MVRARNRPRRRTWRNLLIDKQYQLRFTLFMVVLSGLLMGLLGWWVMTVAGRATTVAVNNTLTACQDLPGASSGRAGRPPEQPPPAEPAAVPEPALPNAPRGTTDPAHVRARPVVTIDDSGLKDLSPSAVPAGPSADQIAAYRKCQAAVAGKVHQLEERQQLIFQVLVGAGVLIVLGLLLYGIKMTHKVAGPLYKVTLYMAKLRTGFYDAVYSLRRGDHLTEFYEHFKAAHAGMRAVQEEDVNRLRAVLAAADQAELAGRSPELAAALGDLRELLDRKENSLA